jgi:hypothetical protein
MGRPNGFVLFSVLQNIPRVATRLRFCSSPKSQTRSADRWSVFSKRPKLRSDGCVPGPGLKLVCAYPKDHCCVFMICPLLLFQTPLHENDVFLVLQPTIPKSRRDNDMGMPVRRLQTFLLTWNVSAGSSKQEVRQAMAGRCSCFFKNSAVVDSWYPESWWRTCHEIRLGSEWWSRKARVAKVDILHLLLLFFLFFPRTPLLLI